MSVAGALGPNIYYLPVSYLIHIFNRRLVAPTVGQMAIESGSRGVQRLSDPPSFGRSTSPSPDRFVQVIT